MLTTNEGEKYLSVNEVIGKYGLTRYRVSKIIIFIGLLFLCNC